MTCEICGCEITEENMVKPNIEICNYCYLENQAISGEFLDEFYMGVEDKMAIDELLDDFIEDELN